MAARAGVLAPSFSHIWISDELLHSAYKRFEHASRTHRRYGSNVPGPMEAHRRIAKRRLAIAASASNTSAPLDLKSWFGSVWGTSYLEPEQNWKWSAPNILLPSSKAHPRTKLPPSEAVEKPAQAEVGINVTPDAATDYVEDSRRAFDILLTGLEEHQQIHVDTIQPCLDFLQSPKNELAAQNPLRLARFLTLHHATRHALSSFCTTLGVLQTLEPSISPEATEIVHTLLTTPSCQWRALPGIQSLVKALPVTLRSTLALDITRAIVSEQGKKDEQLRLVLQWLGFFTQKTKDTVPALTADAWKEMYTIIASRWDPDELKEHLCRLAPAKLCRVLVCHWTAWLGRPKSTWSDNGKYIRWQAKDSQTAQISANETALLVADFENRVSTIAESSVASAYFDIALQTLSRFAIPIQKLNMTLFDMYSYQAEPEELTDAFLDIATSGPGREPAVELAEMVILRLISIDSLESVDLAQKLFERFPSVTFESCHQLPEALIRHGLVDGKWQQRVFNILTRFAGASSHQQWIAEDGIKDLWLHPAQVQCTHEIALQYARSPYLTERQAFRRVWSCYRFLKDRGAPLSSVLTEAFLEAGIARYLEVGRTIHHHQLDYITTIVHQVEGEEVATNLCEMLTRGTERHIVPPQDVHAAETFITQLMRSREPVSTAGVRRKPVKPRNQIKIRPFGHRRRVLIEELRAWGDERRRLRAIPETTR